MDSVLSNIRKYYPSLPINVVKKIYRARLERLRMLMIEGIPDDIRWLIEAKVRLSGECQNSFKYRPCMGMSSFEKKRRAKRLGGCYKCARCNCDTKYRSLRLVSTNREDKIEFIKDRLSKESLDLKIQLILDMYPSVHVQGKILSLWSKSQNETDRLPKILCVGCLSKGLEEKEIPEIPEEWWGNKYGFVSGGFLGSKSKRKKSLATEDAPNYNKRTAFHEEDQENLYKLVQDKATTGKQGLGIKDRPRKVAGVHFQGKKTSFSDSDEEGSEDSRASSKRKFDNMLEMGKCEEPKLKLKKLCRQLLREVPGESLKLKQLKVLIDERCSVFSNSSKRDAIAALKQKLEGSPKFLVEGKRVSLTLKRD